MTLMRRIVAAICLCLALAPGVARADRTFVAVLDGEQAGFPEVTATGSAVFVLNDDETELSYHIEYTGLSGPEYNAHIHNAGPRDDGPVVASLPLPLGTPKTGVWQVTPDVVTELVNRRFYVNIHTEMYTPGEIRGNISEQPVPVTPTTWGAVKALYAAGARKAPPGT